VMVINETFARTWWPGRQAVGSQLRLSGEPSPRTVVGVVRDVKYTGLQRPAGSYFYLPLSQPNPLAQVELTVQVRPRVPPAQAEAAIRRVVSGIDPNLAFFGFGSVDRQVDRELIQQSVLASFIGLVGLLALILVGLGLNATVSETVSQARREIAIRLALGATHLDVQAGIAGRILRQVSYGLVIGLGVGSLVAMALSSLLVGASTTDPLLVLSVAALVVLITGVGVTGQLWRLSRLDPGRLLHET
jgi:putative ABC transport system permease protein